MKTKLFLILLISLIIVSCKERDADPDVLPAATQTGANTAGCLVDGKVWVASKKFINPIGGLGTYAMSDKNSTRIRVDLRSISDNSRIHIILDKENFIINHTYDIPIFIDEYNSIGMSYSVNGNTYYSKPNKSRGKIKITRLDIPKNIVSGTFEIDVIDEKGNVIHITEGRFDKKFD
ncbi:hypothetical protein [Riemerella columbina]|uniref:hypothetical protein n=1 Tax=Riemerella columbina TaxID=103810 RepID=UPI0003A824B1|nr:hypothetical protein [Riemerella columbina]